MDERAAGQERYRAITAAYVNFASGAALERHAHNIFAQILSWGRGSTIGVRHLKTGNIRKCYPMA